MTLNFREFQNRADDQSDSESMYRSGQSRANLKTTHTLEEMHLVEHGPKGETIDEKMNTVDSIKL